MSLLNLILITYKIQIIIILICSKYYKIIYKLFVVNYRRKSFLAQFRIDFGATVNLINIKKYREAHFMIKKGKENILDKFELIDRKTRSFLTCQKLFV